MFFLLTGQEVMGFDCGPGACVRHAAMLIFNRRYHFSLAAGNVLIDGCVKLLYDQEMDRDGAIVRTLGYLVSTYGSDTPLSALRLREEPFLVSCWTG